MDIQITVSDSESQVLATETVHSFEDAAAALRRLEQFLEAKRAKEEQRDDTF